MNPKVDLYFIEGCGRCKLGGTPQCKVHTWEDELQELRSIILETGLNEELKWSVPCYTFQGKNLLLLAAFKEYCALSFFKGSLLKDEKKLLHQPGENSQATRQFRFTQLGEIQEMESILKAYIQEAKELEKAGLKVDFKEKKALVFPDELLQKFEENPVLKRAFEALTPGRQRAYTLYFSAAKQSKTRASRIEKCIPQIFEGKGLNE
ncbi:YdeI/OmpD-associated family protein [Algoriphagus sp. CAU 1675]|uniref:YdeI/OmpD-associated family protein n=1 Tax=Algoriphagus sp. CAU 1675 TaxID=3032597 RepID=UPI0023D9CBD3|nr:YdeI/OmpD-associated family protein [Algoriphagus sp. CAU 1675]MDF2156349.1 YdeI/OmpD-associated family protein [Algoriphagus sp. CAU 1675]